ncbi:hypothetical protein J6590_061451 [Homalodisca vitripennis]|nr:hypothetical protein J6590_061451 [Homalodisca vitripennis]
MFKEGINYVGTLLSSEQIAIHQQITMITYPLRTAALPLPQCVICNQHQALDIVNEITRSGRGRAANLCCSLISGDRRQRVIVSVYFIRSTVLELCCNILEAHCMNEFQEALNLVGITNIR